MPPELFAFGNAFFHACAKISVRFGTQTGDMKMGLIASTVSGLVTSATVAVVVIDDWGVSLVPFLLFVAAGLMGPVLGRLLSVGAIRRSGASVSVPVQSSINPIVATLAGVVLFSESVSIGQLLALALIVSGVWITTTGGSANKIMPVGLDRPSRLLVLAGPMSAGAILASSNVVKKGGLDLGGDPILAALIGYSVGISVWGVVYLLRMRRTAETVKLTRSLWWYGLHGMFAATASLSLNFGLVRGDISLIAPIAASQPVVVLILSALVLRDLEKLRRGTIIGATIVFLGVAYLSFF